MVYMSLINEQIKTSFSKMEHTDLTRFRSGHHLALRRRRHLEGVSKEAVCLLCGEEVESVEHIWLKYPALMVE